MSKPKIILADSDEKYLSPLEIKFLESLDEEIDLEIITDLQYFDSYFSTPKSANALVVSDEFYTSDLQKHNIGKIFVLSENVDEENTDDLLIDRIFKYSNINEIYKQILAKSNISSSSYKDKETVVVLLYSASGGVGKTTLSLAMSSSLASGYNKVLYVNAQKINSFQCNLNNDSSLPNSIVSEFLNPDLTLYDRVKHTIRKEGFDYLPPFSMSLSSLGLESYVYIEFLKSVKATKKYDLIIVDTDTNFDKFKTDLITFSDKVFILLNQNLNSVYSTNMLLKNISCNDSEKYYFVCNNYDENAYNALIDDKTKQNFIVNEYVKKIDGIDEKSISQIAKNSDIQKISYLLI